MATVAEGTAAIDAAFQGYMTELEQCGPVWEKKPEGSPEGEAAWSARQVAEHIASSGPFFGASIARAIGVSGPTPAMVSLADLDAAIAETKRGYGLLVGVVTQVKDEQLDQEVELPRLGKMTVGNIVGLVSNHLKDHTGQLRTLRGG